MPAWEMNRHRDVWWFVFEFAARVERAIRSRFNLPPS